MSGVPYCRHSRAGFGVGQRSRRRRTRCCGTTEDTRVQRRQRCRMRHAGPLTWIFSLGLNVTDYWQPWSLRDPLYGSRLGGYYTRWTAFTSLRCTRPARVPPISLPLRCGSRGLPRQTEYRQRMGQQGPDLMAPYLDDAPFSNHSRDESTAVEAKLATGRFDTQRACRLGEWPVYCTWRRRGLRPRAPSQVVGWEGAASCRSRAKTLVPLNCPYPIH